MKFYNYFNRTCILYRSCGILCAVLMVVSAFALEAPEDCRHLSIYQLMPATFNRMETGTPGFSDLWGPEGHRTDGNLKGITAKLDYIKDMGFNAIWMTPIFDTRNGEGGEKLQATGYFATDYFNIDPRFGTKEDFKELVDEAHKRNMAVILDLVAGHHGGNPKKSPKGNSIVTRADTPNDRGSEFGNIVFPGSLDFFKEVIRYWMEEYGVDGWRLDQCYQVCQGGHNYWKELREEMEAVAKERKGAGEKWGTLAYMVGEDWAFPDGIITTSGDGLRSVFDFRQMYWFRENEIDSYFIKDAYADATDHGYERGVIPNIFLDNHDMGRIGEEITDVKELYIRYAIMAAYSGPVTFYYNDEYAVKNGNGNPDNRGRVSARFTPANDNEKWLSEKVAHLFNVRNAHPAMWRGAYSFNDKGNALEVIKTDPVSGQKLGIIFPFRNCTWNFGKEVTDLLTGTRLKSSATLSANVPVIYEITGTQPENPGEPENPDAVKVYLHYDGADRYDTFYTFIYNGSGCNAEWPGCEMTYSANKTLNGLTGGWFEYTVTAPFLQDGMAMVTDFGERRYPAHNEPGIPIEGRTLVFTYRNGEWSAEPLKSAPTAGIESLPVLDLSLEYIVYDLQGRLLPEKLEFLPKGLYIVRQGHESFKIAR